MFAAVVTVVDTDAALPLNDNSNSFFTSTGVSDLGVTGDGLVGCCIGLTDGVGVGVRTIVVSPTCTGLGTNRFCSSPATFLFVTVTLTPVCRAGVTLEVVCVVCESRFVMVTFVSPTLVAELTDTTGALGGALVCSWLFCCCCCCCCGCCGIDDFAVACSC